MNRYPLFLQPIAKTALWGGDRLLRDWHKTSDGDTLAESWELSVRPKETCTVQNGEAAGLSLAEALLRMGGDAVSPAYAKGERFPLLVKLIDAAEALSVQVHPDDAYAEETAGESGKTELWYIVEAREDAHILYGLRKGLDEKDFALAVREGRVSDVLCVQPVRAGECYFIPSGTVHAIGAGILVAEIQQNSDLTYRVYDYDRVGADGRPRELHVEQAMAVVRPWTSEQIDSVRYERGREEEDLANCRYFSVKCHLVDGLWQARTEDDRCSHLLCIAGEGVLRFAETRYPVRKGSSILLPARMGFLSIFNQM